MRGREIEIDEMEEGYGEMERIGGTGRERIGVREIVIEREMEKDGGSGIERETERKRDREGDRNWGRQKEKVRTAD